MRIRCNRCGKSVSTEVPDNTIIRAWIECPECLGIEETPEDMGDKINEKQPVYKQGE